MDLNHYYGGDLAASPSGDLSLASAEVTGVQRVLRRLLTNPDWEDASGNVVASGDYLAQQDYGGGIGRMIGQPQAIPATTALIRGQMLLESVVARTPAPTISLTSILNGLSAAVQYTDANTASQQFVQFDITK